MFACHQIVLPLLILGKLEGARNTYAFTSAFNFLFLFKWRQVSYLNLVWLILHFYLWLHVDLSCLIEFHNSTNWLKLVFICIYICDIFGHAQIYTNDCFLPKYFSEKKDYFLVSLLSSEDNWWGRAPRVSLFPWRVLRRFNSLSHIYVDFTNFFFCERLSYNPFNCTSILFTKLFLTWYDLNSYSIVLPISISALVFWLWSICFTCINFLRHV